MIHFLKAALLASALVTAPVFAQAATTVGVVDVQGAVSRSAAFSAATAQMKITYATQIATLEARSKALQAELAPLVTAFEAARKAPTPNQTALQTQYTTIQTRQQSAQAELQRLSQPIARVQAYVEEQIAGKLDGALKAAMTARNVQLVLQPQATVSYQPTVDITDAVVAELNRAVPTASITPPANWVPGGQGQAQAQAQTPAAVRTPSR